MDQLSISLLGPFHVLTPGKVIAHFEYDKVRALLSYLAVESDRPHRREFLAGFFWPEQSEEAAFKSLRQALYKLRQIIGDASARPPFLLISHDSIQFNGNSDTALDTAAFSSAIERTRNHHHRNPNTCHTCAQAWTTAAALYRGDFLSQFSLDGCPEFERWLLNHRQMLQEQALQALSALTEYHLCREAYEQAQHWAHRQIEIEPLSEGSYRQLMTAFALAGQRSQALRSYDSCRKILKLELGVEPEAETDYLRQLIQKGMLKNYVPETLRERRILPTPPSPFFGRERELNLLATILENPDIRLISLIGPGGIGKTSLALKAAADNQEQFLHGACYVSLVQLQSPEEVFSALAAALSFSLEGKLNSKTQLLNYLKQREMLIVLDNFEHLLPEGVETVMEILKQARQVVLVVTTTERLNVQAEYIIPVAGLELPDPKRNLMSSAQLRNTSAVALFLQSAQRMGISLNEQEFLYVEHLCGLVEGNPLALELAASLLHSLPCRELVTEVASSLDILATARRDVSERHRSIRSLFDHAWNLMDSRERRVFSRLSVFQGGFSRKSALSVTGASLDMLSTLIEKSLLQVDPVTGRYRAHGLLHKYAREKLDEAGETREALEQHLAYFIGFAEEANQGLNQEQIKWLERVDLEYDNLQVAFETALIAGEKSPALAIRISGALGRYWVLRGRWAEGQAWLNRAMEKYNQDPRIPVDEAIRALYWAGMLAIYRGESHLAKALVDKARSTGLENASMWSKALVYDLLGNLKRIDGDNQIAQDYHISSLEMFRDLGNSWGICISLNNLFRLAYRSNEYQQATSYAEESLKLARKTGDGWNMALSLDYLGIVAHDLGKYEKSEAYLEESFSLSKALGLRFMAAHAIYWLGRVARSQRKPGFANLRFNECLAFYRDLGSAWGQAVSLQGLALVAFDEGDFQRAENLLLESKGLQEEVGDKQLIAFVQINLGDAASAMGDNQRAATLYAQSLENLRSIGDCWLAALALSGLAVLLSRQGNYQKAACLFAFEDRLRDVIGTPRSPAEQAVVAPILQQMDQGFPVPVLKSDCQAGIAESAGDLNTMIDYALAQVVDDGLYLWNSHKTV